MTKVLGDYKGTVPITLITQKRPGIGGTSSEIVQLRGVRYAVMQEPSKGDKINEGIMKEITGGDPIQGRALFKETVTFIPQFKLVVAQIHYLISKILAMEHGDAFVCVILNLNSEKPRLRMTRMNRTNFRSIKKSKQSLKSGKSHLCLCSLKSRRRKKASSRTVPWY